MNETSYLLVNITVNLVINSSFTNSTEDEFFDFNSTEDGFFDLNSTEDGFFDLNLSEDGYNNSKKDGKSRVVNNDVGLIAFCIFLSKSNNS